MNIKKNFKVNKMTIRDHVDFSFIKVIDIFFESKIVKLDIISLKIIYVRSPSEKNRDCELEFLELSNKTVGKFKFSVEIRFPYIYMLNYDEISSVSGLIFMFIKNFKTKFFQIGFYVFSDFYSSIMINSKKNIKIKQNLIKYHILKDKPRIVYY
ncbi:hypothetical protein (nucleomorph) [Guillardia theta]|uniref:Uncharacterized protein n=1 Tax=Guillardia theta TaxID=55529 RepID=Q98RT6_GUITH|nr:hypothetical protein GTHECHR1070 [Guillardia theta]AAK39862.1 hypothetical protein [Guillardia theta]|mmetsp:Transcript_36519/g.113901  ORF Transcript_36519/g.113901 Transcript_36519/m.113901 type:complete len:154 (+) Transcript_36519:3123-3584(+)